MTITLSLLFIALDLLTLMIYPVIYVHGKVFRILKAKDRLVLKNSLNTVLVTLED